MPSTITGLTLTSLALCASTAALAQDRLEQANPERVEESRPDDPLLEEAAPPTTQKPGARAEADAQARPSVRLTVVELLNLTEVSPESLQPTLAPFLNRPLSTTELKDIVNALVAELHRRGYIFASARIPPQSVEGGRLTIEVEEGFIDGVVIEGADQAFTRSVLERLADGRPVTKRRLERRLLLANDGTGTYVGRSSYQMVDGRAVLKVRVQQDPVLARVSLDNWGSQFIGPVRARTSVRFGGVFDGADALGVSLSTVPADPREYVYGRASYVRRLTTDGTEGSVSVSAGETRPGASLRSRDTAGSSRSVSVGLSQNLVRSRGGSLWGDVGLTVRSSAQDQFGRPVRDDRFTNLAADLFGAVSLGDARLRGRVTATQGLGLFNSTRQGDPLSSRSDGSARFTSVFAAASLSVPIAPRVAFGLAGEGQIASRPLLSSEEFGVGGADIGRGYDYSERLGDEGAAGLAELSYTMPDPLNWVDELKLSAFIDGGVARDIGVRRFDGSIASAGLGVAADLDNGLAGELSVGLPLTGPRDASDDRSPRIGFTLAKRF